MGDDHFIHPAITHAVIQATIKLLQIKERFSKDPCTKLKG
jgi:hypothetical protein